jgi:DtxR family transcriptional regulator, Mn-dependent transcriptional regulator
MPMAARQHLRDPGGHQEARVTEQQHEEALELVYSTLKRGIDDEAEIRHDIVRHLHTDLVAELADAGYLWVEHGHIILTPEGELIGRRITRRHRLAERLLVDVLGMDVGDAEAPACEFEHVISTDVAESICTLLGHPRECPHGFAIPDGECCRVNASVVSSVIVPLTEVEVGRKVRVAYMRTHDHGRLRRLMAYGIVPGVRLRVHRVRPTYIIQAGETSIAMEREVAEDILVVRGPNGRRDE